MRAKNRRDKLTRKDLALKKNFVDLTGLIRSIQRAEGNPDCFGRAEDYCDRFDCTWREYCLTNPEDVPHEEGKARRNDQTLVHGLETGAQNRLPK